MIIKIADMEISNDERLNGTLIEDLEKIGYLVIEDDILRYRYIIARKEEKE